MSLFQAQNQNGTWKDYAPAAAEVLAQAYASGVPSLSLHVRGLMFKFDFEKMQQTNRNTSEVMNMRPPTDLARPLRKKTLVGSMCREKEYYAVRVPKGSPGTKILVPHPKNLGKTLQVRVPAEANVGQPLFVQIPGSLLTLKGKVKASAACGAAASGCAAGNVATGVATGAITCCLGLELVGVAMLGLTVAPLALGAGVATGAVASGVRRKMGAKADVTLGGAEGASDLGEEGKQVEDVADDAVDLVTDLF